jgi:spore germination protein
MIRTILIGVFAIAVVATGYWGYQEHQEKNLVLIHAENNYQRAFHNLTFHIDRLHDEIGMTLAMSSSSSQLSRSLAEVWKLTSEAHGDVGQLPLTLLPFNKTEEFLAKIGEFSYRTAIRNLDDEPLSEDEYKTLKKLYKNAGEIQDELRNVQAMVLKENLRWMDVELALASATEPLDNTIIDGFKTVDKKVDGYSDVNWGPEMTQMQKKEDEMYKNVEGDDISKEEAVKIAQNFFGFKQKLDVEVVEGGKGANYGFYSLTIKHPDQKSSIYMDLTKKGGFPIWVLQDREIKNSKLSLNEAAIKGNEFLKDHEFTDMELLDSAQYDNVGVFSFIKKEEGVRIFSERISMKVALDEGDIIGFQAEDYLLANHEHVSYKPELTKEEARSKVNPNLNVMEDHIAIIVNELGEEVLCFEFMGTLGDDTYRMFINAKTGNEEKVEKLKSKEPLYENL